MDSVFLHAEFLRFPFHRRSYVIDIPEKKLPYLDLTFCLEGNMEYYYEGKKIILGAGDGILYPPGSVRKRNFSDKPAYYASFNIQFPEGFEPSVCGYLPNCIHSNTIRMLEAFKKDFESVSSHKQEKCAAIFYYLYHQLIETVLNAENPHIKKVKQYVLSHLSEPLTLHDVAAAVHLAPQYLCTLFKKHTGMTIVDFIIEQRIDLAKRLIITQDTPLFDISESCGFKDYNYFSKTFKKLTGTTATNYRKLKQKNY